MCMCVGGSTVFNVLVISVSSFILRIRLLCFMLCSAFCEFFVCSECCVCGRLFSWCSKCSGFMECVVLAVGLLRVDTGVCLGDEF